MTKYYNKYVAILVTVIGIIFGSLYVIIQANQPTAVEEKILDEKEQLILEDSSNLAKLEGVRTEIKEGKIVISILEGHLYRTIICDNEMNVLSKISGDTRIGSNIGATIIVSCTIGAVFFTIYQAILIVIDTVPITRKNKDKKRQ